jgi:hypothetical protein
VSGQCVRASTTTTSEPTTTTIEAIKAALNLSSNKRTDVLKVDDSLVCFNPVNNLLIDLRAITGYEWSTSPIEFG